MRNDFKIRNHLRGGGIAKRGLGVALRGGGIAKRGMGVALKDGGDVAQDKKLIKKAIRMHDEQEHQGKHTDLSKLKKGGEVMHHMHHHVHEHHMYESGGEVEDDKSEMNLKKIDKEKNPGLSKLPTEVRNKMGYMKKGGKVKKKK
jgi:hypothetical protein